MEGTLCYRHGYRPRGCADCARAWEIIARNSGVYWADFNIYPQGPVNEADAEH